MNRIQAAFEQKKMFLSYFTAGDGGLDYSLAFAKALIDGGVTMMEIGAPFSDPTADGPVIQRAHDRALRAGTDLDGVLELIKNIKQYADVPIILFSYYNPIFAARNDGFYQRAAEAGVDGILVVDLPYQEADDHEKACKAVNIEPVYVITPYTTVESLKAMDARSHSFLYYACRKGTTGVKSGLPDDFANTVQAIKRVVKNPLVSGFGIADAQTAREALQYTDGFVVGSYFVKLIEDQKSFAEITTCAKQLRVNDDT
jgi:tryptophan synthase alpha chain